MGKLGWAPRGWRRRQLGKVGRMGKLGWGPGGWRRHGPVGMLSYPLPARTEPPLLPMPLALVHPRCVASMPGVHRQVWPVAVRLCILTIISFIIHCAARQCPCLTRALTKRTLVAAEKQRNGTANTCDTCGARAPCAAACLNVPGRCLSSSVVAALTTLHLQWEHSVGTPSELVVNQVHFHAAFSMQPAVSIKAATLHSVI